jgi:hypothetical protein
MQKCAFTGSSSKIQIWKFSIHKNPQLIKFQPIKTNKSFQPTKSSKESTQNKKKSTLLPNKTSKHRKSICKLQLSTCFPFFFSSPLERFVFVSRPPRALNPVPRKTFGVYVSVPTEFLKSPKIGGQWMISVLKWDKYGQRRVFFWVGKLGFEEKRVELDIFKFLGHGKLWLYKKYQI